MACPKRGSLRRSRTDASRRACPSGRAAGATGRSGGTCVEPGLREAAAGCELTGGPVGELPGLEVDLDLAVAQVAADELL